MTFVKMYPDVLWILMFLKNVVFSKNEKASYISSVSLCLVIYSCFSLIFSAVLQGSVTQQRPIYVHVAPHENNPHFYLQSLIMCLHTHTPARLHTCTWGGVKGVYETLAMFVQSASETHWASSGSIQMQNTYTHIYKHTYTHIQYSSLPTHSTH